MNQDPKRDAKPLPKRILDFDWSNTPLGAIEQWPPQLRTAVAAAADSAQENGRAGEPELERDLADTTLLQEISAQIVSEANIEALYDKILDVAARIMRADFANMQMLCAEPGTGSTLRLLGSRGFPADAAKSCERVGLESHCTCGAALRSGKRVIVPDVEKCDFLAGTPELAILRAADVHALQTTPLLSRTGDVVGMVSTHWRTRHRPAARDLRLLDILARQAADLVERKQAEEALRASEAKFSTAFGQSPLALTITSLADGRLVEVNEGFLRLSGYTREEALGRTIDELHLWADPQQRAQGLTQLRAGARIFDTEARFRNKSGEEGFGVIGSAIIEINSRPHVLSSVIDITQRKRSEEALRQRTAQFETLLNQAPLGVFLVDADFRIRQVNPTAVAGFDDPLPDLIGRDLDEVVHLLWTKDYADEVVRIFRHTLETGEPYATPERRARRIDRDVTEHYEWRIDRIVLPDARYGVVCYFRDIAARVEARQTIAASLEEQNRLVAQLQQADERKNQFLAMLGHELRNPLSAVRNAVEIARLDEAHRPHALEIARRQLGQLGRLIDDLLDVTRITQDKITLHKERVSLTDIVERAVESIRSFVDARRIDLTVSLLPEPVPVEADAARLEQVFVNLLSNATKYTEPGGQIAVVAERTADTAAVRIRDTGIGIAPEMLSSMWDLFVQGERTLDRSPGGLGIGLTVTRRLVELHGGRIQAYSQGRGQGAEFVVSLPTLPSTGDELRPATAGAPRLHRSARVLLVEDNPDAAESLTVLLELLGHRVRCVENGLAALDAARANVPDVMLVDIGLPGMDGYEVARRIRRDPELKDILLVALTGYGREEDREQAMRAGFDYHLVKPVSPDALDGLVARFGKDDPKTPRTVH